MPYLLEGTFVEACDCYVVCPCWVDDDPDDGHCTGLFAWSLAEGSHVGGVGVAGRTVVAVTTHQGRRGRASSATVLFVDSDADDSEFDALTRAFAGEEDGPLADLATVSGIVLGRRRARIEVEPAEGSWSVTVTELGAGRAEVDPPVTVVRATGEPRILEDSDDVGPLTLTWTALSRELGIGGGPVVAQQGDDLSLRVGELPGAYLELTGRSGMRGAFSYRHPFEKLGRTGPRGPGAPTGPAGGPAAGAPADGD